MADLSITAANVIADAGYSSTDGVAGAALTAGMAVYADANDAGRYKGADANASLAASTSIGIAMHGASTGQPVKVMTGGTVTIGATVAVGTVYVASATAGGIAPSTDLASGWFTTIIGVATTAAKIKLGINAAQVAVP